MSVFDSRSRTKRRLVRVGSEIAKLNEELRVLSEQRAQIDDEASDAHIRSLVSDSPLAASENTSAQRTSAAFKKDFDVKTKRLAQLIEKQDTLLDHLTQQK